MRSKIASGLPVEDWLPTLREEHGPEKAERLLEAMDDIYSLLVTVDYPDAITNGLRRQTDLARGIIEKTRGDVTVSLRGEHLTQAIRKLSSQLNDGKDWLQPNGQSDESGVFLSRNDEDE